MDKNYSVYQHVTPDGMYYFGQSQNVEKRWECNGIHYKGTALQPYIEKYGWDNIQHIVLFRDQTRENALWIEDFLIETAREDGVCINKNRSGNVSKEEGYNKNQMKYLREQNHENEVRKQKQYYEQNKDKIREQQKQYREQNKDKIREYREQYREQNKDKIKEQSKQYREQNKEKIKEQSKQYYETNKDKIREYQRDYQKQNKDKIREQQKQYREQNKEKIKEQSKQYYEQNKDKIREYNRQRYQRKKLEKQLKEIETPLF